MAPVNSREVRLAQRPKGDPTRETFAIVDTVLPEVGEGEVLVRNLWMSVDPYMRLQLGTQEGLHPPKALDTVMDGGALGVVEKSNAPGLPVGAHVVSQKGWRDAFVAPAAGLRQIDPSHGELSWHVGLLGLTGITAYNGVEHVLKPQAGEILYVSGAAGAVGSIACQLAKKRGAKVIGTAGTDEKVSWLKDVVGIDAAANYKTTDIADFVRAEAPDGLDLYFDNVGGETLNAVLGRMKKLGRIALCGSISQYGDDNYRAGPSDFFSVFEKSLSLLGFNASTWPDRVPATLKDLADRMAAGEFVWEETKLEGLENAPAAFASLFKGDNLGKMVVKLG